jgi:hypothetical protein
MLASCQSICSRMMSIIISSYCQLLLHSVRDLTMLAPAADRLDFGLVNVDFPVGARPHGLRKKSPVAIKVGLPDCMGESLTQLGGAAHLHTCASCSLCLLVLASRCGAKKALLVTWPSGYRCVSKIIMALVGLWPQGAQPKSWGWNHGRLG